MVRYSCPACGGETNSRGEPFQSYRAVALHIAGKIWAASDGAEHRNWIRNHAPGVDLLGWSQRDLTFSTMGELADAIYPAVELVLDEGFEQEGGSEVASTSTPILTESEISDFRRKLMRL